MSEEQVADVTVQQTVPSFDENLKPDTGADLDFDSLIPEEYKDKPYMQKVKDVNGLFKAFDNAQQLLGKKLGGAPDMISGYDVKMPEEMPEGVNFSEESLTEAKELAQKLGLNNEQLQGLIEYDLQRQSGAYSSYQEQEAKSKEEQDAEFSKMALEAFGENVEETLKDVNELLKKYSGDHSDKLSALDNNSLIMLALAVNGIKNDYIKEDSLNPVGGTSVQANNQEELLAEVRGLLSKTDIRRNPLHPEHSKNEARITEIFTLLNKMGYNRT